MGIIDFRAALQEGIEADALELENVRASTFAESSAAASIGGMRQDFDPREKTAVDPIYRPGFAGALAAAAQGGGAATERMKNFAMQTVKRQDQQKQVNRQLEEADRQEQLLFDKLELEYETNFETRREAREGQLEGSLQRGKIAGMGDENADADRALRKEQHDLRKLQWEQETADREQDDIDRRRIKEHFDTHYTQQLSPSLPGIDGKLSEDVITYDEWATDPATGEQVGVGEPRVLFRGIRRWEDGIANWNRYERLQRSNYVATIGPEAALKQLKDEKEAFVAQLQDSLDRGHITKGKVVAPAVNGQIRDFEKAEGANVHSAINEAHNVANSNKLNVHAQQLSNTLVTEFGLSSVAPAAFEKYIQDKYFVGSTLLGVDDIASAEMPEEARMWITVELAKKGLVLGEKYDLQNPAVQAALRYEGFESASGNVSSTKSVGLLAKDRRGRIAIDLNSVVGPGPFRPMGQAEFLVKAQHKGMDPTVAENLYMSPAFQDVMTAADSVWEDTAGVGPYDDGSFPYEEAPDKPTKFDPFEINPE